MIMKDRIEQLERIIPKVKANRKILPKAIECMEWELKALKAERQLKNCSIPDVSQCILSDYTDWLNEQDLTVNKIKTYGGFKKWFGLGWLNKKVSSEDLVKKFLSEYGG